MQITINGSQQRINNQHSLRSLIQQYSDNPQHVIAEVNGEIIKNPQWDDLYIKEGDSIELLQFVGGGRI